MIRRTTLLAVLSASLVPLNSTLVALALRPIGEDLDVALAATSWLVGAYLIATLSLQALAGRASDIGGRRRALRIGLVGFAVASVAAAVAPTLELLLLWRTVQAAFGALVFASGLALVRSLPAEHRPRAMARASAAVSAAPAFGLLLGGAVLSATTWRGMLLINLPIALAALALTPAADETPRAGTARFDWAGALLLLALSTGVATSLSLATQVPLLAWPVIVVALAAATVAWLRIEWRHPEPAVDPRLLGRSGLAVAVLGLGLGNLAMYALLLAVPLLFAGAGGPAEAGGMLAAFTGAAALGSAAGGRLDSASGRRRGATAGLAALGTALAALAVGGGDASAALLAWLVLAGAGLGLANFALFSSGLETVSGRDAGVATGVLSSGRYLGGIVATALFALLVDDAAGDLEPDVRGLLAAASVGATLATLVVAVGLAPRTLKTDETPEPRSAAG